MRVPGNVEDTKFGYRQLAAVLNGQIDLADNLNIKVVEVEPGAIAATVAFTVTHSLGRIPRGVFTAGIEVGAGAVSSIPGVVYFSDTDRDSWTENQADLRYSLDATDHSLILMFF